MLTLPSLIPTGIGSIPHTDPLAGCQFILEYFPEIPFWPQLPQLSFFENMYVQYSERLPGVVLQEERIYVDSQQAATELIPFYEDYLSEDLAPFAITEKYAQGLYTFASLAASFKQAVAIKGQVTGPISFGLQVTDENKRAIIYQDELREALVKNLARKAQWQEKFLQQFSPNTIIFLDEPYLSAFGSAYVNLERETVISMLEEIFTAVSGATGVHCCANTDWSLLLETSVDIISLDAYNYADTILLYPEQLKNFFARGGRVAWGIVPTTKEEIAQETEASLWQRWQQLIFRLEKEGISPATVINHSLLTPACGVGRLEIATATKIFAQTRILSDHARSVY